MKTIKIAPEMDEIQVSANEVRTDFAGGIVYRAEGLNKYKEEYIKEAFMSAVAIVGKRWHLEQLLNDFLGLQGHVE